VAKRKPRAKPKRRTYTTQDRAAALAALAANGGRTAQTAQELGIPRKTLERWVIDRPAPPAEPALAPPVAPQKRGVAREAQALAPAACSALADKLEEIANNLADVIPGKVEKANLQQCMVSLGIAVEKVRLLREQSTQNLAQSVRVSFIEVPADAPEPDRQAA
jgi:transposase-like protein